MLKLATVFSGIGAIEHALMRMGIKHKIVFACDNGDINILSKKIKPSIEEIWNSFFEIESILEKITLSDEFLEQKCEIIKKLGNLKNNFKNYCDNSIIDLEDKKIKKKINEFSEKVSMIFETINTLVIQNDLAKIKSYKEKKDYVDNLYAGKESKNKVMTSYFANYDVRKEDFHWNILFLDGYQYHNKVDLFVGGSPCQSFSLVGKQRGLDDTRGTLFYEYARLVSEIKPKVFIYENVKAILSNDGGKTWNTIKKVFTELGYNWTYSVLNAKDYGIPQNRERIFVIGIRNDIVLKKNLVFPPPTKTLDKKMKDYLLDNTSSKYYLPKKGVEFVTNEKNLTKRYTQINGNISLCQKKNQQFNWHGDFVFTKKNTNIKQTMTDLEKYFLSEKIEKYVLSTGTKGFYSKPKTDLEIARPLLRTMHKMHRAGIDNYVTTLGMLRKLTPRECLRLMGFCDSFKIVVPDIAMYQQAGNSIVVDVLIAILKQIFDVYDFDLGE